MLLQNEAGELAEDALFAVHYQALRRMARQRLSRHESFTLLDTTALVHESFMRLRGAPALDSPGVPAFLAYAGRVMRSVIVDAARARLTLRRGERAPHLDIDEHEDALTSEPANQLLHVDDALNVLERTEPRAAQVVRLMYFAGMTEVEVGLCLSITERTVRRDADKARMLLRALLA